MTQPFIDVAGLTKSFGPKHVLKGVDMSVTQGESLVLIGTSGSGKTLLLKCILGLIPIDAGKVIVGGEDTARYRGAARDAFIARTGMLFQRSGLFDSLTTWENIGFRALQAGDTERAEIKSAAIDKLVMVGLDPDVADLSPAELSGGMQKRVGIARAIFGDPELLLLDEPTAGLDPIMSNVINDLILDLVRQIGCTAISIDSDMAGAGRLGDKVAMLHEGRIIWHGDAGKMMGSGNDYVDQFVHSRAEGPIDMPVTAP
ncbi:ATP-binding cassette domain-containing protein [Thalassospiraceae bacterium LMO-JJ14]|nr:ATP-binding cassette domain-containing protein [Thalassospiraceae bacterium LMO-JJ14]